MKLLFDENSSIEDRIKKLEIAFTRLARRSKKTASAVITPYPISYCVTGDDIKGDILKYMFLSKGVIKKGLIVLDKKPAVGVKVDFSISNDDGGSAKSYVVIRKSSNFEPNIEILPGDRLTISVSPMNPEKDKLTELWLTFTWVPHVGDTEIKNHLIKSLDKTESEVIEDASSVS